MATSGRVLRALRALLPSPFTIAALLTVVTFLLAFVFTGEQMGFGERTLSLLGNWEKGLWEPPLLAFTVQMMLILVLGHVAALSRPFSWVIDRMTSFCNDTASSAATVTLLTLLVSFFNWGLGLVFGAIFARKVAERAVRKDIGLNYGLIGAAGYSGLMVWHGGISGSAPIKVAEEGHLATLMSGITTDLDLGKLPSFIPFEQTIFSSSNLLLSLFLLMVLPLLMYLLGKGDRSKVPTLRRSSFADPPDGDTPEGAELLDRSPVLAYAFGGIILVYSVWSSIKGYGESGFSFITPNMINLLLLGLCIVLHGSFHRFLHAVDEAIAGAAGILIQFPLYFGIMGLMKYSGLVQLFSEGIVANATATTYPFFTFISAAVVNVFVPSGGGQWAVQGPIIIQASEALGVSLPKAIMAMAYGDQLTNMLQPFWALPLLGITGLRAKDILPYSLVLLLVGFVIFGVAVWMA